MPPNHRLSANHATCVVTEPQEVERFLWNRELRFGRTNGRCRHVSGTMRECPKSLIPINAFSARS
jgi:hypothetical protein